MEMFRLIYINYIDNIQQQYLAGEGVSEEWMREQLGEWLVRLGGGGGGGGGILFSNKYF